MGADSSVLRTKDLPPQAKPLPHIEDPHDLLGLPVPRLLRPIILVHGLAQHADTWVNFKNFLTNDPRNLYGGIYTTKDEARFLAGLKDKPGAKVFAIDLSDNLASPADVGSELHRAIGLVRACTGAQKVDVVTHSMGAVVAREALRNGEDGIDHLVMVAPPNQGAYEANIATRYERIYSRYPPDRMGAMHALRVEYGPCGGVSNEYLHGLNESWARDEKRVDATIITGVGLPTPDRFLGFAPGDGMVAARRTPLGNTPTYIVEPDKLPADHPFFRDFQEFRYNHLQIVSEPEVYAKIAEIVTSDPPPPPPAEPQQPCFWDFNPAFNRGAAPRMPQQMDLFSH